MTFTLRLRAPPGDDAILALRWLLKRARDAGLTCTELNEDDDMNENSTLLRACGLWEKTSKNGRRYLTGRMAGLRVLILENHDRDRGEDASTHWLMFGEAAQRQQQPRQESQQEQPAEPERERAANWSPRERERHTAALAETFDRQGPDEEPF